MHTPSSVDSYTGCPVQHALQYLGGKWQMGILWNLRMEPLRFIEIKEKLPGLTEKVLTQNLKFFEGAGIVQKEVFASVPPRVEYRLTPAGQTLIPVIEKIVQWGYAHLQDEKVNEHMSATPYVAIEAIKAIG